MKDLKEIINLFSIHGDVESIVPLGEGLINDTSPVANRHLQ